LGAFLDLLALQRDSQIAREVLDLEPRRILLLFGFLGLVLLLLPCSHDCSPVHSAASTDSSSSASAASSPFMTMRRASVSTRLATASKFCVPVMSTSGMP